MRLGLLSDPHIENFRVLGGPVTAGVNLRCRLVGGAFARGLQLAGKVGCDRVAVLGDLFNTGKPSPEVIGVAADAIAGSPVPVYVIPGNHDRSSDEPGNNALAALREVKNCVVVDEPLFLQPEGVILAPFSPRPPVEYFTELLERAGKGDWSILGHVGIVGPDTSPFLINGRNIISVEQIFELGLKAPKNCNLHVFASGDFHQHVIHEGVLGAVNIVQVGALCQANFGDPLEVGKLCVLDSSGGITEVYDVPGPRFLVETFEDLASGGSPEVSAIPDDHPLFLSVNCNTEAERREATTILEAWDGLAGWKTELVSTTKQQTEVVEAVQGAVQVEDALQEWAAAQPGVSQAVKDRAVQIALECLR
jgi:hypothetical protein